MARLSRDQGTEVSRIHKIIAAHDGVAGEALLLFFFLLFSIYILYKITVFSTPDSLMRLRTKVQFHSDAGQCPKLELRGRPRPQVGAPTVSGYFLQTGFFTK